LFAAGRGTLRREAVREMFKAARAIVKEITEADPAVQRLIVTIEGRDARAINYTSFAPELAPGDEVIVNTTAVELGLGTGGCHFVIAPTRGIGATVGEGPGHIMKLRYTPHQHSVLSLEEEASPHRPAIEGFRGLAGFPVVVGALHSHVAPAAIAAKHLLGPGCRVVYVMTDVAALGIGFSRSVGEMRRRGLIDATITCGQAFGGDFEAVNVYTALIAAREALGAQAAIVAQGPGNVGTGTRYGFGGIEQGEIVNAAGVLGGRPIAVLRLSFADPRERHRGISHHSLTVLGEVALVPAVIPVPEMQPEREGTIIGQLQAGGIFGGRHSVVTVGTSPVHSVLEEHSDLLRTMGRSYDEDPEFFWAAAAAGVVAAQQIEGGRGEGD
jgi:hypothetical protein